MSRQLQVKFVDVESGLDAACAPLQRVAALMSALQKALAELPGTLPESDLARVTELLQKTFAKAVPAGPAPPWAPVEYQIAVTDSSGAPIGRLIRRGFTTADVGLDFTRSADGDHWEWKFDAQKR
jgi:hypothetical protein